MMELPKLQFIRSDKINRIAWDQNMERSEYGLPYACSWYLDAVMNDQWNALISDDYSWMMPLPSKTKWGIEYLPTPLFVQQLGIFGPQPCSPEITRHFVQQILHNYKLIEFNFNHHNAFDASDYTEMRTERSNVILHIPENREALWQHYHENAKRNIQKASAAGLRFGNASIRSVIKLFDEHKAFEIPNWKIENYNVLERLFHMASFRGFARCYGIYNSSGVQICGAVIIEWKNRALFLFSGNSNEGMELGAMPYLIHQYLLEAPAHIRIFDFEGSDHPGLKRFYQSFGAIDANYVHLRHDRLPFYVRWFKR